MKAASQLPVVVLISGSGSNLQAMIDTVNLGASAFSICAVISNRPGVLGLKRAEEAGIPTETIDHRQFPTREGFDHQLMKTIDSYQPGLVVLAGFMRILTEPFVRHYLGRLLNIHPSLLPRFQGLHTHQAALDAGDKHHGASVHFVTGKLDGGPVILQAEVPVLPGDTAESLASRVLIKEHLIYPLAMNWFARGRLRLQQEKIWLDGEPLDAPLCLNEIELADQEKNVRS